MGASIHAYVEGKYEKWHIMFKKKEAISQVNVSRLNFWYLHGLYNSWKSEMSNSREFEASGC